jgi:hypothetical protein
MASEGQPRIAAGKTFTTHHRHSGKWTDEARLEEAVAQAMGASALLAIHAAG